MNDSTKKTGILLIAHGSRRESANADLVMLADLVRERRPNEYVDIAYLELAEPTIPQGIERCLASGADRVLMLPYFLSSGAHVTTDLERFREEFAKAHPLHEFVVCAPLGLHPLIVDIVLDRLAEWE
ncbi:MAG: CbiX/SirB N-terminal domain-containing protein [Planctomycetota bacterium]|nr:CbiX/SirB N-terminal domain-containing protein [Planctomycetota bacterium]MDA1212009.1 CbiX/SirB N-terminal domain-containing protein [Planctomycetota bacterium]